MPTPKYILLPVHETFHGKIPPAGRERFLRNARKALRGLGFSRIEVLYEGTNYEKELWGDTEAVGLGLAVQIFSCEEVDEINIDWLPIINWDADGILAALRAATGDAG